MSRPVRTYVHTYTREAQSLQIVAEGITPCRARNAAYLELERRLVREDLPRRGWRLLRQMFLDTSHYPTG